MFDPLFTVLSILGTVLSATWWFVVPVVLFEAFRLLWLFYIQSLYAKSISYIFLEVKIPKNIETTPKAMEQVFAAVSAIDVHGIDVFEKWWQGKVQSKISFDIVGYAGGVYFYVYTPAGFRNLVEAAIYAQYPDAEIRLTNDYTEILPKSLPNETYDLYGTDVVLARDDAYPIRMYEHFEDKEDERRLDPIAALTEAMSKLKEGEIIWLQFLLSPADNDWKKKGEELVKKLIGAEPTKSTGFGSQIFEALSLIFSYSDKPVVPEKKEAPNKLLSMTQAQKDVVEEVEHKLSKIGFKTTIRFIYIDHRDSFSRVNVAAVDGAFSQFNTLNLNAFKPNLKILTKAKGLFKRWRLLRKKQNIYWYYIHREFGPKTCVLNIEELATIYHPPIVTVAAPMLQRLESRKGGPPPTLPIE